MTSAESMLVQKLSKQVEQLQQALLSATGVLKESEDPKAREAARVLYKGVKQSDKISHR